MKTLSMAFAAITLMTQAAFAEDRATISLVAENDSFIADSDRHYTNGLYTSWTGTAQQREDNLTSIASALMLPGYENALWRESYFAGQAAFTPQAIWLRNAPLNDRPYAGWLFAGARLYRESAQVLDKFEVTLGVVGPASMAGDLQRWWHKNGILGGRTPRGWDYQLSNEPGIILSQQRKWRVPLYDDGLEIELMPQVNGSIGNVFTYAEGGAALRVGQDLAADWGQAGISPGTAGADFQNPKDFAWNLSAGFNLRAVGRNIFLDGNSFSPSRNVGHKAVVGDLTLGVSLMLPSMRVSGSYVRRTEEFSGQRGVDEYIGVALSVAN
jgi:hypothetical protein